MNNALVKLESKNKIFFDYKLKRRNEKVYVEGRYEGQDRQKLEYMESYYFMEDVEKPNPHFGEPNEPEKITVPTRRNLKHGKSSKPMSEIDGFIKALKQDMKHEDGMLGSIDKKFAIVFPMEVKAQGYFETSQGVPTKPEDWIVKSN